ncbi:MAG: DNA replication and repair protein RecF [Polyangiaceae bacterium]
MTSTNALDLLELRVEGLRNLETANYEFSSGINVVTGDNGQGKTSLLEAIYLVATTRSFRTARLKEVVRHGADTFVLRGRLRDPASLLTHVRTLRWSGRGVEVKVDGNKPESLARFAATAPIVVFHPEELQLSTGPAALRRRLLDRVAFYASPEHSSEVARFTKGLRARQELLRRRATEAELEAYENQLALLGVRITKRREQAAEELGRATVRALEETATWSELMTLRYRAGGSTEVDSFLSELASRRERDTRMGAATFGPHRDELELELGGRSARVVASQGQHRLLALALKAAERALVAVRTGMNPIQLLDDVSSELDRDRTAALLRFLRTSEGQVFITTPRGDLFREALSDAQFISYYQVVSGRLESA